MLAKGGLWKADRVSISLITDDDEAAPVLTVGEIVLEIRTQ